MAAFTLPLAFSQWTVVKFPNRQLPQIKTSEHSWSFSTQEDTAGGYALFFSQLPKPPELGAQPSAAWSWSVSKFPKSKPRLPFRKGEDDYPLRVGFLLSDAAHPEKTLELPARLFRGKLDPKILLSYALFYGAVAEVPPGPSCGWNPYNDRVILCLKAAGAAKTAVTVNPAEDALKFLAEQEALKGEKPAANSWVPPKLEVIGSWIFADSDNTMSNSESELSEIRLADPVAVPSPSTGQSGK